MSALVVYESIFGNTRAVALAIAEGLGRAMPVEVVEVADAPVVLPPGVELLVVGGPTHAHGMTTPQSRSDAARRAGDRLVSRGQGVREWLERLQPTAQPIAAAAFDTRLKGPELLWGSAGKVVAKRLDTLGFRVSASSRSFLVGGPTGPSFDRMEPAEIDRAHAWGEGLAKAIGRTAADVG